jgi:hypothetical protein
MEINTAAGLIVLLGYPTLLIWIVVNLSRRRRLLDRRIVPDADAHIDQARRSYEAVIGEAKARLVDSELRLQHEGRVEAEHRLQLLRRANHEMHQLCRTQRREFLRLVRARHQSSYLNQLCALNNLERFESLERLIKDLIVRERALVDELRQVIKAGTGGRNV